MQNAYVGRKVHKRKVRALWITRVGAAAAANGTNYGALVHNLAVADVMLNRKVLAELAMHEPKSFAALARFSAQRSREV